MKIFTLFRRLLIVAFIAVVGCSSTDEDKSTVRVFHASPGISSITLSIDNSDQVKDLRYGEVSNAFSVERGRRRVRVDGDGNSTSLIDQNEQFSGSIFNQDSTRYTLFVGNTPENIDLIVREESSDLFNIPRGQFSIRAINLAVGSRSLDFYVVRGNNSIINEIPTENGVSFRSFTRYFDIDEGQYRLVFARRNTKEVVYDSGVLSFFDADFKSIVLINSSATNTALRGNLIDDDF
jgi:hypothetical protein